MTLWIGLMFLTLMLMLLLGYPVAFTLGAVALLYGGILIRGGPAKVWLINGDLNGDLNDDPKDDPKDEQDR